MEEDNEKKIHVIPARFSEDEKKEYLDWGANATERSISAYIRWCVIRFTKWLKAGNIDIDDNLT